MIFILTNKGLYIIKLQVATCNVCPKYDFCTDGPLVVAKYAYKEILNVLVLEGDQRFGIRINQNSKESLFFVQFAKATSKRIFEKILMKNMNIIWTKDIMYEEAISLIVICIFIIEFFWGLKIFEISFNFANF